MVVAFEPRLTTRRSRQRRVSSSRAFPVVERLTTRSANTEGGLRMPPEPDGLRQPAKGEDRVLVCHRHGEIRPPQPMPVLVNDLWRCPCGRTMLLPVVAEAIEEARRNAPVI